MGTLICDPVCGMPVKSDQYTVDYLQVHYAFCSLQCQEFFLENPRLYVESPSQAKPKKVDEK